MAFDAHKNLAIASVATAPSPPTSGTSITVSAGQGARFPAVPFNATVWPFDLAPDPVTAEVIRVTARTGDVLSGILRAQEGTTARTVIAGDLIAATITAKSLTDIESGTNFPLITTPGDLTTAGQLLGPSTGNFLVRPSTTDGADTAQTIICGGGGIAETRGAAISVLGNEVAGAAGDMYLVAGAPAGKIHFFASGDRGTIHPSGGFSWGSTTDPGNANIGVAGELKVAQISAGTPAGADNNHLWLCGGGGYNSDRGSLIGIYGNEAASGAGAIDIVAGEGPSAAITFYTTPGYSLRGRMSPNGGFNWGSSGGAASAGAFSVGSATRIIGSAYIDLDPGANGLIGVGVTTSAAANIAMFVNPGGIAGYIQTVGLTTAYGTSSDARLKTSRGRHTDPDVLRRTVIHDFTWKADGTPGRGVFAQEAVEVAPFAVSVGGDEVDGHGLLMKPWGVDYSKYVPDLIAGWQDHDQRLAALEATMHRSPVADLGMGEAARVGAKRPSALTASAFWLALSGLFHRLFTP